LPFPSTWHEGLKHHARRTLQPGNFAIKRRSDPNGSDLIILDRPIRL